MFGVDDVIGAVLGVVNKFIPDKTVQLEMENELRKQAMGQEFQTILAQIQVNQEESKSTSVFVAGWRPFVGWVCGISLAYTYILQPFIGYVIAIFKTNFAPPPGLQTGDLMTLLLGMLGLGAMRSWDKKNACDPSDKDKH